MTEFLLNHLGASDEQISRQRQRIREDLFGTPFTMELLLPLPVSKLTSLAEDSQRPAEAAALPDAENAADDELSAP
jgi:hypothetical protein